jgi:2-polyprenyl-6-hydroxyphenyl methylase/3-demethylubiquinone-9 3-methyltransferase
VSDVDTSVSEAARVLKPGGWYLFDTINRTARSKLVMIKLFQEWDAFRWAPRDLHDWDKFVTPEELERSLTRHGLKNEEFVGFVPGRNPLKVLSLLRSRARGKLSYGEMGRQMQITVSRTDISGGYGGHARKTR